MEHYVTLFDSLFLPQGLALHSSLERHAGPYTLWVLCVDDQTYDVLGRLGLPNVRLMRLVDVETPELQHVKSERSRAEYCWTLTPFTPRFVYEADPAVQRVTYLDADLWFRQSPAPIFRELELSGKQVLITDHAYAPEHDRTATSGRYCVQFMVFVREGGEGVRSWWEERCIEWCYARAESGKFGDQKYLDDWPERFGDRVHVLQHAEWTRAPWNVAESPYDRALFFHFHGLRLLGDDKVNLGGYPLSPTLIHDVYAPYLEYLARAIRALRAVGFEPRVQQQNRVLLTLKRLPFMFSRRRRFVIMPMQVP
jgi:hypothetical protein